MLISVLGHSLMTKSCFFHRSKVRYKPHILIIPKLICCNTTLTSLKNRVNHEQYIVTYEIRNLMTFVGIWTVTYEGHSIEWQITYAYLI